MASFVSSPVKNINATIPVSVDFISQLAAGEAVVAVVTNAVVFIGVDPAPEDILSGSVVVSQDTAYQLITGGIEGVIYTVGFDATTNLGNHLIIYTNVAVIGNDPFQVAA